MRLATKISAFYLAASGALVVVLAAIALIAFRAFSLTAATAHAQTLADSVRVSLTEMMILGTIGERQRYLERLRDVPHLRHVAVVRSPLVDEQFGTARRGEREPDPIERQVLTSGQPHFATEETATEVFFRATIPYVARPDGTVNCLQCHQVPEGSVLGAITVTLSLDALRTHALLTVGGIVLAVGIFAVSLLWLLNRLLQPVTTTAQVITEVVHEGVEGRFDRRIEARSNDETGTIASEVNRLVEAIAQALTAITEQIALVTGRRQLAKNQLHAVVDAVTTMAAITHFKQAIEEDRTPAEIYQRIAHLAQSRFAIPEVALLEVRGQEIVALGSDGVTLEPCCSGCDPAIHTTPELCRAVRTGHLVEGVSDPLLCTAQRVTPHHPDWGYCCFPILFSGQVGAVIQWRTPRSDPQQIINAAEEFRLFVNEAAPVLESKRLMAQLRESALRDPLTGLRNRRFLEESVELLIAQTLRNRSHLAVLMVDIDYFKIVNDTYGHDAGDTVIRFVAKLLQETVRASDWVVRFGGEEFLVVLVDTPAEAALPVAEKIRSRLETAEIALPTGETIRKTLSIGVADFPADADGFWQVVKFADVALYHAKESGRNRVVRFTPDLWQEKSY